MKMIEMPIGGVKKLMEDMGVSKPTVCDALRYRTKSELANRIRQRAVQLGGVVMETAKTR